MNLIKVSAASRTSAVAGAIAGMIRQHHQVEIQVVGAGAVNRAVKALIVANSYLRLDGIYLGCTPEFAKVTIEDQVRTAIKLIVEPLDLEGLSRPPQLSFFGDVLSGQADAP